MNKEEIDKFMNSLREKFKGQDSVPAPIRVKYRWGNNECVGGFYGDGSIEGFPGLTHIADENVQDVQLCE